MKKDKWYNAKLMERPRYPEDLVHRYGAKAGILMYVATHLPDISQMSMVVSEIDESARGLLDRADAAGIPWPRVFRSSAIVELDGFEGVYPTSFVDTFKGQSPSDRYVVVDSHYEIYSSDEAQQRIENIIEEIASFKPLNSHDSKIQSRINVIIAEKAQCDYTGTYIAHPNQPDSYVTTIIETRYPVLKPTLTYDIRTGFKAFGTGRTDVINYELVMADLKTVFEWHSRIAYLPEMDPNWSYQVEFGLNPAKLFQIRPFKAKQMADFRLDSAQESRSSLPIVIGITPKEGIDLKILTINLRSAYRLDDIDHLSGIILQKGVGMLAHDDISVLRRSDLALIYPDYTPFGFSNETNNFHIRCDGYNVEITPSLDK